MRRLILTILLCITSCCFSLHTLIYHIDSKQGNDHDHCGRSKDACKSLSHTWTRFRVMMIINSTGLYGEIVFMLTPGFYDTPHALQPLTYDCLGTKVTSITVMENRSTNYTGPLEICQSFAISHCNATFLDIHFVTVLQSIKLNNMNYAQMKNIFFKNNKVKPLIHIHTINTMVIENVEFSHNKIEKSPPYLFESSQYSVDLRDMNMLLISNLSFSYNTNLKSLFRFIKQVHIYNITALKNGNFSLVFAETSVNGSLFELTKNYGNALSDGYFQMWFNSVGIFKDVSVKCNTYEHTKYGSVFQNGNNSNITCVNCRTVDCEVFCGAGEERSNEVFCQKCSPGRYSRDWQQECQRCLPGYYTAKKGCDDCAICTSGTYCPKKGCSLCRKCNNDFFTSNEGSSSCSRMSLFFVILLAFVILLTFSPIIIYIIKNKRSQPIDENDENRSNEEALVDREGAYDKEETLVNQEGAYQSADDEPLVINN